MCLFRAATKTCHKGILFKRAKSKDARSPIVFAHIMAFSSLALVDVIYTNKTQSFSDGEIKFEDCKFTECSAVHGGAITVSGSAKLTVDKCTFTKCTDTFPNTYGYGGAILSNGSDCSIENSIFNNCRGTEKESIGGAFAHIANKFSLIFGCSFENCSAAYGGSVAWHLGGSGSIYDSVFENSKALI
eukprot:MONOS_8745.1-p1 / transcript=MONOS_8745.1 / gene=MONOS_8745 / organism=Monocercomonoides_exilis_PA203 / gene_product=unspecified product / transcript_product=unspecified product / location=Mono_scaffold00337:58003-58618(+) / protein_length=186 / sequence_SO=supercontig / SO=protein_coding / is_pseudo=false